MFVALATVLALPAFATEGVNNNKQNIQLNYSLNQREEASVSLQRDTWRDAT